MAYTKNASSALSLRDGNVRKDSKEQGLVPSLQNLHITSAPQLPTVWSAVSPCFSELYELIMLPFLYFDAAEKLGVSKSKGRDKGR